MEILFHSHNVLNFLSAALEGYVKFLLTPEILLLVKGTGCGQEEAVIVSLVRTSVFYLNIPNFG